MEEGGRIEMNDKQEQQLRREILDASMESITRQKENAEFTRLREENEAHKNSIVRLNEQQDDLRAQLEAAEKRADEAEEEKALALGLKKHAESDLAAAREKIEGLETTIAVAMDRANSAQRDLNIGESCGDPYTSWVIRDAIVDIHDRASRWRQRIAALESENAKLREEAKEWADLLLQVGFDGEATVQSVKEDITYLHRCEEDAADRDDLEELCREMRDALADVHLLDNGEDCEGGSGNRFVLYSARDSEPDWFKKRKALLAKAKEVLG
jgi:chromosome segregation ATPase